ncbi:MAG: extracellular solute-binding protein [Pseudomonadota bacterium]
MTRRMGSNGGSAALLLAALACGALPAAPAGAQEEKVLNIYNWAEYMADDTVRNFEKETGIKVRIDYFDGNETLHAKLVAGRTGYDIVVPSALWAGMQIQGGLLRKLDKSKLPNLANMDPALQAKLARLDPGNEHLVNWLWGYTTVGINVDKVKAALGELPMPANPWDLVFDPKYMAKLKSCGVSFVDAPADVMPPALVYLGKPSYSKNSADYAEAGQLLKKVRPYVTLFSSVGYINDLANGTVCVALGWSGDINIARQRAIDNKNGNRIEALVPKSGGSLVLDTLAIPSDAPHPGNALLFMNYIMRPEVHASQTNKVFYANANAASIKYVKKEIADNRSVFLAPADLDHMAMPELVSIDVRRAMARTYTAFKSGL